MFRMSWGGSLDKDGTQYFRTIRVAEKAINFLEELKKSLSQEERKCVNKTIEIITAHISKLTEGER